MSIERELLKNVISRDNIGDFFVSYDLYKEIKEFLAQPEHIADVGNMVVQDPVAWKVIDGTNGNYMFSRIKPTERSYKYDVVIPLYIAPPKRESLSDEHLISAAPELLEALSNWINALDDPSEWMKCRDDAKKAIEKAHGIGGGE